MEFVHASDALAGSGMARRRFLKTAMLSGAALAFQAQVRGAAASASASDLPAGAAPRPVPLPHFPDRVHAFVWRNWTLVPLERLASVLGASPDDVRQLGVEMGLPAQVTVTADQQRRSYITVIRRNWHLLPYDQLLQLLGWTAEHMAFTLREDDFLYVKLGSLKPRCEPLHFNAIAQGSAERRREIAQLVNESAGDRSMASGDALFAFVERLSRAPAKRAAVPGGIRLSPRFCYSYFALYGDPLMEPEADPYPEGYLAQLAAAGVDGVWLQGVLNKLAPFPWDASISAGYEQRLARLKELTARAARHGMRVFVYLNEPRAMPAAFFKDHPALKGVAEGAFSAMCTSDPSVREWIVHSVAAVARAVPDLGGFFTITASENLTHCWSHHGGARCPRCSQRSPGAVIAEVNQLVLQGIEQSGAAAQLIAWDWGWADAWAPEIIEQLPRDLALMSVSEWSIPIQRGGVNAVVGEYSISTIGPGPRAKRHWDLARKRGLRTIAKIQAGNTWELSAAPYIPALENVARHAVGLLEAQVDGLMLGWTLGGYPSPNLEVVMEVARRGEGSGARSTTDVPPVVGEALRAVATRRYGKVMAPFAVEAWLGCSAAFREFPYDGGVVYNAPLQAGPSNLLWAEPTGYRATMVGIPYDDLASWRGPYPPDVFISQLEKVARGFEDAAAALNRRFQEHTAALTPDEQAAINQELNVVRAAAIHFRSTANQARFVRAREALRQGRAQQSTGELKSEMERVLQSEITLCEQLYAIQTRDSRIGFEATNQYYYVPLDLMEKILNCRFLLGQLRSKS